MLNYYLYKIGQYIALRLPVRFAYGLARLLSDIRYCYASLDRAEVTSNLKAIFPQKDEKEIAKIRRNMFRNFAKYLVDFFRFEQIDRKYIAENITLKNFDILDRELKKKKGVIVLTAHLGNWELGGAVVGVLNYPFWAVALPHKNKKVDAFFNGQRERKGVNIIPFGKAARLCLELLKAGSIVALVGDRDFSKDRGIVTPFLGREASLPKGPAAFALKTGASIVPGFLIRNPDDSFTMTIEEPLTVATAKAHDENALKEVVRRYTIVMERYIRKYPEQWYMFKRFWVNTDQNT